MKKLKKFDNSILNNFKDIRISQILSFFVILISTIINLFLIVRVQKIIDIIIKQNFLELKINLIKTIPIIILYSIIIFFEQYFLRKLFFIGELKSINFFYNKSLEKSLNFHNTNQSGVVLSKITNDSKRISNYLSQGLVLLFSQIGILSSTLIVMANYNAIITAVMFLSIIICFILVRKINKKISKYNIENQKMGAEINQNILQSLIGIFDIKQLNKELFFSKIIEKKLFIDKYKIGKKYLCISRYM